MELSPESDMRLLPTCITMETLGILGASDALFAATHTASCVRAQYSAAPETLSSSVPRAKSVATASTVPPSARSHGHSKPPARIVRLVKPTYY